MINNKKGQTSAGSAALLVAIIAAMILLYTLFLPPDDRARLLEETNGNTNALNESNSILLRESPGRLDLVKKATIDHKISSFNLLSTTSGKLIKQFDGVYAQRTVFKDSPQTLQFDVADPENTDNVLLSFNPKDQRGMLIITLNNNIVSEKEYTDANPLPITLPKSMLSKTNTLKFAVSSPGALFFLTNKYTLENVKIFADVTDRTGLENDQDLFFTEVERQNLEKATLSLMPACKTNNIGRLDILINNQGVYSGIPDCEMPLKVDISPGKILEGDNKLRFIADKGSYVIDQAKITSSLKDAVYPTYYFTVDDDTLNRIANNTWNVNMSMIFVASDSFEDVEVEINGRKFSIDNRDRVYNKIINPYLREENNAITLRPLDSSIEVVELKIFKYEIDNDNG